MKIAILASEFYPIYGGVGTYTQQLVRELSKNHEVHVFTVERVPKKEVLKHFKNIQLHYLCKANDYFVYNFKFQLALLFQFKKFDKKHNFDIIHSMNLVNMPDIFLKFFIKKEIIVTAHTSITGQVKGFLQSNKNFFKMAPSEKGSLLVFPYIWLMERLYLFKTKHMITVSNKFAKYFRSKGYKKDLVAIHNGVDLSVFDYNHVKVHEISKKRGIKIMFLGRLITQKGINIFSQLMQELKDEDIHFIIVGKGETKDLFRNIPKDKYTYFGFVNNWNAPAIYKAADIFVQPSYYENFSLVLLEAMSMKCACVTTDVGATDEMISKKYLFKAGDAKGIINRVKELMKDKKLRLELANEGYKNVINNFTVEKMVAKTEDYYRRAL
jgi:glycosyltransferase involved in cell wall biosynthesis